MKIFVTGASGYNGSAIVNELINAGHQVTGLARSEKSAQAIREAGADVLYGDLEDLETLKKGAKNADGIIHAGFYHDFMHSNDFSQFAKASAIDKTAIEAIGEALAGTNKALVVTSGTVGLPLINGFVTEESVAQNSPRLSEATALELAGKGINASVVRLAPSVHDKGDHGFVPFIIEQARINGLSAYPGTGENQWVGVHRLDAAKLFRLAVEKGIKGALYNGVAGEPVKLKDIAELIGEQLNLPVGSVSGDDLKQHFDWLSHFITMDCPATNFQTRKLLGWEPEHIGLLADMRENYF